MLVRHCHWVRNSFVRLLVAAVLLDLFEVADGYIVLHERRSNPPMQKILTTEYLLPWKEETVTETNHYTEQGVILKEHTPQRIPISWNHPSPKDISSIHDFFGVAESSEFHSRTDATKHRCPFPWGRAAVSATNKATFTETTTTNQSASSRSCTPKAVAAVPVPVPSFSPFESWCLSKLDIWYDRSQSLKCPFFRRRSGDALDALEAVVKETLIRSDRREGMGLPQAYRPAVRGKRSGAKQTGLSIEQLAAIVRSDWRADSNHKGYYLTGRLTTAIYRDDCLFLGPDPDLPLRGLRKYLGVASHLFEYQTSRATLTSLEIVESMAKNANNSKNENESISTSTSTSTSTSASTIAALVATWELEAVLRLPWKPRLPHLSGQTIYHTDPDGLVACHEERWLDCSAPRAFCTTFLPGLAKRIWPGRT